MPKPYSDDLRERVVKSVMAGHSCRAVAKIYGVSGSFVVKLVQRWHTHKSVKPAQFGGYKKPVLTAHSDTVRRLVAKTPDATITELQELLNADGIVISRAAVGKYLKRMQLTYKKSPACSRTGQAGRGRSTKKMERGSKQA